MRVMIKNTYSGLIQLMKPLRQYFLIFGFIGLASVLNSASVSAAEKPLRNVADLRYGVVLYEYFQGHHFQSLSELMVAKERGGIQGHKDNPELIEGSLSLAFGMERQAGDIYDRLLGEDKPLAVRNAAWFYLAKIRYQRGELDAVKSSLSNIIEPISADLVDEMDAMKIQLLIKEAKFEEAEAALEKVSSRSGGGRQFQYWRPYLNFNLGAIYARYEKLDEAQNFFSKVANERLSKKPFYHKEQLALYDKAYIASGFSYFQQQDYQQAINEFGNVRQSTPLVNDALLGYGWATAKLGDYKAALIPWTVLSQRPIADDAVQESLIAIPHAYLQLGDTSRALDAYARAEQVFIKELALIDDAGNKIVGQSLIELFKLDYANATYSWLVPENNYLVEPVSRYLLPLFAQNRFQNSIQSLFDLDKIRLRLESWKISLDSYRDLMSYRLKAFRLQQVPEGYRNMTAELESITEKRNELAAIFSQAKQEKNVFMLLDDDRQDLVDMVESGEQNAKLLSADGQSTDEENEWLQRYRGLLLWSANLDFDDRLWKVEADLGEVDGILASAAAADNKIQGLLTDAPDIKSARTRIDAYFSRVDSLLANNKVVMASIENDVRAQLFASLALQRQRVQFYLGEARLAVAQLYDNEYLEGSKQ
jgi:hypothetical protein